MSDRDSTIAGKHLEEALRLVMTEGTPAFTLMFDSVDPDLLSELYEQLDDYLAKHTDVGADDDDGEVEADED